MSAVAPPFFEGKRMSPKRCLFGRPNKQHRQTLEQALTEQENRINTINDDVRRFRERWGFDPESGKPVSGGLFECVPADISAIPSVYLKGYAHRKLSPVQKRERTSSPINMTTLNLSRSLCVRPSVKRKLPLDFDEDVNDENKQTHVVPVTSDTSRVQVPANIAVIPSPSSSVESSPNSDSSYPSPLSLQELQHRTPRQHQSNIKDFFQIKKSRPCHSRPSFGTSDSTKQTT